MAAKKAQSIIEQVNFFGGKVKNGDLEGISGFVLAYGDASMPVEEKARRYQAIREVLLGLGIPDYAIQSMEMEAKAGDFSKQYEVVHVGKLLEREVDIDASKVVEALQAKGLLETRPAEQGVEESKQNRRGFWKTLFTRGPIEAIRNQWKKNPLSVAGGAYLPVDGIAILGGLLTSYGDGAFGVLCAGATVAMFFEHDKSHMTEAEKLQEAYEKERGKDFEASALGEVVFDPTIKKKLQGGFREFIGDNAYTIATGGNGLAAFYGLGKSAASMYQAKMYDAAFLRMLQWILVSSGFSIAAILPEKGVPFEHTALGKLFDGQPLEAMDPPVRQFYEWMLENRNALVSLALGHNMIGIASAFKTLEEARLKQAERRDGYQQQGDKYKVPYVKADGTIGYRDWMEAFDAADARVEGGRSLLNPLKFLPTLQSDKKLHGELAEIVNIKTQGAFIVEPPKNVADKSRAKEEDSQPKIRALNAEELSLFNAVEKIKGDLAGTSVGESVLQSAKVGDEVKPVLVQERKENGVCITLYPQYADLAAEQKLASYDVDMNPLESAGAAYGRAMRSGAKTVVAKFGELSERIQAMTPFKGQVITSIEVFVPDQQPNLEQGALHDREYKVIVKSRDITGIELPAQEFCLYGLSKEVALTPVEAKDFAGDVDTARQQDRYGMTASLFILQNAGYLLVNTVMSQVSKVLPPANMDQLASLTANKVLKSTDGAFADKLKQSMLQGQGIPDRLFIATVARVKDEAMFYASKPSVWSAVRKGQISGLQSQKPHEEREKIAQFIEEKIWAKMADRAIIEGKGEVFSLIQHARMGNLEAQIMQHRGTSPDVVQQLQQQIQQLQQQVVEANTMLAAAGKPIVGEDSLTGSVLNADARAKAGITPTPEDLRVASQLAASEAQQGVKTVRA